MTYPGTLSLSRAHLTHLADLLRAHRARIGSRWRKLTPGRQALLVLAHLRNGDTYTRLAAGFEVGLATVWRHVREAVDLLATRSPSLTAALWRLAGNGHRLGILDGTLVRTDRLGGDLDRLYYSGKHHHHGVNLQGLVDPRRGPGMDLRRAARLDPRPDRGPHPRPHPLRRPRRGRTPGRQGATKAPAVP